jgi:sugar phosphate isomerase/epimerase
MSAATDAGFAGWCLDPGTLGFDLAFDDYLAMAAAAGCTWAEVPIGVLRAVGARAVRAALAGADLRAGPFSCPWEGSPNGSVPEEEWAQRVRLLPEVFARVGEAGGRMVSAFFRGDRDGMVRLSDDALARRCAVLARLAEEAGLRVCVELNDVDALRNASATLDTVDSAALVLLLDSFHLFRAGLDHRWIDTLPPGAIGWVHISGVPTTVVAPQDLPRTRPFEGTQDLAPILAAVAGRGYDGPLSIEVLPAPGPDTDRAAYAADLVRTTDAALAQRGRTRSGSDRTGS